MTCPEHSSTLMRNPFFKTLTLAACVLAWAPSHAKPVVKADPAETTRLIVEQTNEFRRSQGLGKTVPEANLTKAAQYFADFMARTDRYGHEADGKRPADRAESHGYAYCLISENIAYTYSSAGVSTRDLAGGSVKGWKESPEHRKNMLDPGVTDIGVAIAQSEKSKRYYAVQMFGRPRAMRVEFQIANKSRAPVRYDLNGTAHDLLPRAVHTHQQCRTMRLTVPVRGQPQPIMVEPANGDRYAIERENAKKDRLKKE
jgi:uncharacterized protein YkwD